MKIIIKTTTKEKSDEALEKIFKQIGLYRDWLHVECYVDDNTIEFGVQEDKHQRELIYYTLFGNDPIPFRRYIADFRAYIKGEGDNKKNSRSFVNLSDVARKGCLNMVFKEFSQEDLKIAIKKFETLDYNYQKSDFLLVYRLLSDEVRDREEKEGVKNPIGLEGMVAEPKRRKVYTKKEKV